MQRALAVTISQSHTTGEVNVRGRERRGVLSAGERMCVCTCVSMRMCGNRGRGAGGGEEGQHIYTRDLRMRTHAYIYTHTQIHTYISGHTHDYMDPISY